MVEDLVSLADVALLAQVGRPVVTNWRIRRAQRDPFPEPVSREGGQEFFSCADVVAWLTRTGLGRNPRAAEDAVAFQFSGRRVLADTDLFHGLSALLCLEALTGPLPGDPDDLLDLADGRDPDDEFLRREVEAVGDDLGRLSAYASLLVRGAMDAAEPLDALLRSRRTPDAPGSVRVAAAFADLVLDVAMSAADEAGFEAPVLCLPRARDVVLLANLPDWLEERPHATVALFGEASDRETRLARRWLATHGVRASTLEAGDGTGLPKEAVLVVRLDDNDREADLAWLNELTLQCSASMRAVVVGAASALTGPLRVVRRGRPPASGVPLTPAGEERRQALQSGFTRAIVRLPAGLLPSNPALRTAMWVLGPAHDPAETYCTDVSAPLTQNPSALVDDIAAALVGRPERRGHAAPGRFVRQAELVMADGDLVAPHLDARMTATRGLPRLLNDLVPAVSRPVSNGWALTVVPNESPGLVQRITLSEAVGLGHVTLIRGASLSDSDLVPTPDVGVLRDPRELRSRDHLAGLTFRALGAHEHLRVTEPGDLIFSTRGAPIVLLDDSGGLVVAAPSRVLRCHIPTEAQIRAHAEGRADEPKPQRLVPALLTAELALASAQSQDWRRWPITLLPPGVIREASEAAAALAERQRLLEDALGATHDLMSTLASALGAGLCSVTVERKSA